MRHRLAVWATAIFAPATLLLALAPAAAQDDKHFNLRCMANFANIAGSDNPKESQPATMGVIYFLGRLDDGTPNFDIQKELGDLLKSESMDVIKGDLKRCRDVLLERAAALQKAGAAMQAQ